MGKFIDLTGQRFGRLTVIQRAENKGVITRWLCECDCGNEKVIRAQDLKEGKTQSCGCLRSELVSERNYVHGHSEERIHNIWRGMKKRCLNPKSKSYKDYGARGIRICDEWLNDFQAFYDWAIANGYSDSLSIDRIDNDGNYRPSNCRWADRKTQNINQGGRKNNKLGLRGVHFDKNSQKYRATIVKDGIQITLGSFNSAEDAIKARKEAEEKYYKQ